MDVGRTSMQLENQNKEELGLEDRARCVYACVCKRERPRKTDSRDKKGRDTEV